MANSLIDYFKTLFTPSSKAKSMIGLEGLARSEAILHNLIAEEKIPGIAVIIHKQGKTILEKGFGYADIEHKIPADPQKTIFRTASISKCITGLALGKMVEEGIVDFDDSFYKHVPYYPKKEYDFTLRQLASHTAGIREYRGKEFGLNKPYSIKDSLQVFQEDPLVFQPGKGYLYTSFDFVLLSLAMQEASGVPFEDYVKDKVLNALEMTDTFPPEQHNKQNTKEIATQFYTKHLSGFRKAMVVNNYYKLAGGGYLSTCNDIAKLGQAVFEKRLLKSETYAELLTSQMLHEKPTYYGLGFQVSQDENGRRFVGHVGSSVGAYSNLFIYPEEELVVSVLVNCTDVKMQPMINDVINSLTKR